MGTVSAAMRAFVLTGGGALGATQAGMLQALLAHGVRPELLVGTSVGALNAAYLAAAPHLEGAEALGGVWQRASRSLIFPLRPRGVVLGLAGRRDHLVAADGLRQWISSNLLVTCFEDALVPLHVVATDLGSGNPVVLSEGPLLPALLASTALPGIFPPVHHQGRVLVDGGTSADVPVLQAEELGATEIWVLPTSGAERDASAPKGAFEVLLRSIGIILGHVTREHLAQLDPATRVHVLPAPTVADTSILDFRHTDELIAQGRVLADAYLHQHAPT
jgi:NTE family protein